MNLTGIIPGLNIAGTLGHRRPARAGARRVRHVHLRRHQEEPGQVLQELAVPVGRAVAALHHRHADRVHLDLHHPADHAHAATPDEHGRRAPAARALLRGHAVLLLHGRRLVERCSASAPSRSASRSRCSRSSSPSCRPTSSPSSPRSTSSSRWPKSTKRTGHPPGSIHTEGNTNVDATTVLAEITGNIATVGIRPRSDRPGHRRGHRRRQDDRGRRSPARARGPPHRCLMWIGIAFTEALAFIGIATGLHLVS